MPKKQKKGGGKTEEEKLLYLQQRAQAEEELAKKKENMLSQFLKNKLQEEQRNSAVNLLKLNEIWRTILRQTRAAELQKDVSILHQTFEKQLDGLDGIIKSLEGDLQEAERQSAQVNRIHLHNLERLWAQQDKWLQFLQQQWENNLQHLSSSFQCERKQMLAMTQQHQEDLDNAELIMEQQFQETRSEIYKPYNCSVTRQQHAPEVPVTPTSLSQGKKQQGLQLMLLDDMALRSKEFAQKHKKVEKKAGEMQSFILQMKRKTKSSGEEHEAVKRDIQGARNEVNRKTHRLRDQLTQAHTAARKRLSDLTTHSSNATKRLQEAINKGERVLRVADMCRKLEMEQEASFRSSPAADDHSQEGSVTEEEQEKERPEFPELQPVMRRISSALLNREALKRRRADLSRENQQLRLLLRQRLDGMTVSDGTLDGPHALLTAQRAPTMAAPTETGRRPTVVEAAHVVKYSL